MLLSKAIVVLRNNKNYRYVDLFHYLSLIYNLTLNICLPTFAQMAAESPRTGLTASITRVNFHPLMRPTINPATKVVTDWTSNPILSPIPSLILETSLKNKLHCFKIKHYIVWSRERSYLFWKCNAINLFLSEKVEILPTVQSCSHFLNTKLVIFFGNCAISGRKVEAFHVGKEKEWLVIQLKLFTPLGSAGTLSSPQNAQKWTVFSLQGGNLLGWALVILRVEGDLSKCFSDTLVTVKYQMY